MIHDNFTVASLDLLHHVFFFKHLNMFLLFHTDNTLTIQCTEDEFECNRQCFPKNFKCDNYPDCSDYSDEAFCGDDSGTMGGGGVTPGRKIL